ncbi:Molybdopterin synthase catalytic subunit [Cladorrhinum samala]|uniref:Molybdopterin synthase catalytic subunit n=1 Tax=Cladorrhinum samala TaxID=585594 RepID=A0AAV9I0L9_9PEZI|nr:Molybdopterin synthase catalytic subunit [Cladorrhinum samala]
MAAQENPPVSDLQSLSEEGIYVALTSDHLNSQSIMDRVRSPAAGAIVLFAGTTRNTFQSLQVSHLSYSAYVPLALRTMLGIATSIKAKHGLNGIAMIHRLGEVPIGEESILIAVSSAHRQAAWRAGEEALEECKDKVEVWKREEFVGGEGVWRANRDGKKGVRIDQGGTEEEEKEEGGGGGEEKENKRE